MAPRSREKSRQLRRLQRLRNKERCQQQPTILTILKNTSKYKAEIIAGASRNHQQNAPASPSTTTNNTVSTTLLSSCDDSVTSTTTTTTTISADNGNSSRRVVSCSSYLSLMSMIDAAIVANDLTTLHGLLLQQQQSQLPMGGGGRVVVTGDYIAAALGTAVAEGNVAATRLLFRFVTLYGKEKQYFVNENHLGEDCLVHLASMMRHLHEQQ
jgi:hypothetical protein